MHMASPNPDTAIDDLIPALIQCFGVIILGYVAGRWQFLTDSQAKGLNSYVTKFALPAVFFKVMVSIDFSGVCWYFVAAVSLSKLVVFVIAFTFTLLLSRKCLLGVAGILSMFVSQSNDVALGYPVLYALYPDLASYVYMFAPAQLVILNPISYVFLEWHQLKVQSQHAALTDEPKPSPASAPNRCRRLMQVLWRVVLNPIFFMTVIGVVFNFILRHNIPAYLDGLLKVVADSFTATALFTLGFGMVGKMGHITRREVYILVAILMLKLIICPFVTRELCVQVMSYSATNETLRYSTFGFLYGAIPTAPPVYLFAAEYDVLPVVIGIGLVLGTFLCAPMIFILARMTTMYTAAPSQYDQLLGSTVIDVSWMSVAGCLWTAVILLVGRKAFRIPHRFTVCYLGCVLLSCVGVIMGYFLNRNYVGGGEWLDHMLNSPSLWAHYIQFSVFFVGCTGARLWTVLIAFVMLMQRVRGTCFVLRHQGLIYLAGFIMPLLITSVLLLAASRQLVRDVDPAFQYGRGQLITSLLVLLISTIGTTLCLIGYMRFGSVEASATVAGYQSLLSTDSPPSPERSSSSLHTPGRDTTAYVENLGSPERNENTLGQPLLASHRQSCRCPSVESRRRCFRELARYERLSSSPPTREPNSFANSFDTDHSDFQHPRHLILLFILLTTMFFGICLCTWRLAWEAPSGVYLVLEFLDGTFNFGQGVALFVIFGLDADLIILPIKRVVARCLRKVFGNSPIATQMSIIPVTTPQTADHHDSDQKVHQFVTYHMTTCKQAISTATPLGSHVISTFSAQSLKQWLLNSGLVRSNLEADEYLELLQSNRVVEPAPDGATASFGCAGDGLISHPLLVFREPSDGS